MQFSKVKNGIRIKVLKWDNKITLIDISTGEVLAVKQFSDNTTAIYLAKKLMKG